MDRIEDFSFQNYKSQLYVFSQNDSQLLIVPLVLYGIYYAASAYSHMENGFIENGYDWYRFFSLGASSVLLVYPFFAAFTLLLSYALWKLNKDFIV